jgi:hypothetical protein
MALPRLGESGVFFRRREENRDKRDFQAGTTPLNSMLLTLLQSDFGNRSTVKQVLSGRRSPIKCRVWSDLVPS